MRALPSSGSSKTAALPSRRKLGRGRSGEVWLVESPEGRAAVKVFFGDTLSNLVHYLVSGAPNPYIWNEDAIRTAFERLRVPVWGGKDTLVEHWLNRLGHRLVGGPGWAG